LVAVAMAGGYGYARLQVGQVASVHVPGLAPAPPPGRPMNLLVVGSDTRQGLGRQDRGQFGTVAGQRGDVILLVHLVPATHRAWMLSIPRDLYVPEAGTGDRAKINSALARGPEQLVETIKADFGIPVSHYVLVDFDGFRAVVDAVGGLRLDFPPRSATTTTATTTAGCSSPPRAAGIWTASRPWPWPAAATTSTEEPTASGGPTPATTSAASAASRSWCGPWPPRRCGGV
jgi:LytR_cpsA_psr family